MLLLFFTKTLTHLFLYCSAGCCWVVFIMWWIMNLWVVLWIINYELMRYFMISEFYVTYLCTYIYIFLSIFHSPYWGLRLITLWGLRLALVEDNVWMLKMTFRTLNSGLMGLGLVPLMKRASTTRSSLFAPEVFFVFLVVDLLYAGLFALSCFCTALLLCGFHPPSLTHT